MNIKWQQLTGGDGAATFHSISAAVQQVVTTF